MIQVSSTEIRAALERLGPTAEEVYESLMNKGVRIHHHPCYETLDGNHQHHPGTCPVHQYLAREFPEIDSQSLLVDGVMVYDPENWRSESVKLPSQIREFIIAYDNHRLQELIPEEYASPANAACL